MKYSISPSEFSLNFKTSKSLKIRDLSFKYFPNSIPQIGFIVSKKYGGAVQRNLFKRRCRCLFKSFFIDNKMFYSIIVRPNQGGVSFNSAHESFNLLYNKLID